jgi:hypothetical protein
MWGFVVTGRIWKRIRKPKGFTLRGGLFGSQIIPDNTPCYMNNDTKIQNKNSILIFGWVMLLILVLLGYGAVRLFQAVNWSSIGDFFKSEVHAYPLICEATFANEETLISNDTTLSSSERSNKKLSLVQWMTQHNVSPSDCDTEKALPEITFKVYRAKQYVVLSGSLWGVQKLNSCTVINRKNWECDQPDGDGTDSYIFNESGLTIQTTSSSDTQSIISNMSIVSKSEWEKYPPYSQADIISSFSMSKPSQSEPSQPSADIVPSSFDAQKELNQLNAEGLQAEQGAAALSSQMTADQKREQTDAAASAEAYKLNQEQQEAQWQKMDSSQ